MRRKSHRAATPSVRRIAGHGHVKDIHDRRSHLHRIRQNRKHRMHAIHTIKHHAQLRVKIRRTTNAVYKHSGNGAQSFRNPVSRYRRF